MKERPFFMQKSNRISYFIVALVTAVASLFGILSSTAQAASLGKTFVRFDRMKISTATTGTVCAQPTSTATETSVKVTFPTGYTVSTTVGDWAVSTATTTGWPSGSSAWTGIGAPTGSGEFVISGQSVNFQSGNITAGTLYCFNWTSTAALTTKGTATNPNTGQIITQTTGGSASDTGDYATATISDDQVTVSATVPPSFSFSLSANSTSFSGNLTSGSVQQTTGVTATVATNAPNGWIIWAKDLNTGLTSPTASKTIAATGVGGGNQNLSAGTEGYVLGVEVTTDSGAGTPTSDAAFAGTAGNNNGGGLDTTFRTLASSTGTALGDIITLRGKAAITAETPAATDYADTWTVIGAGQF